MGHARASATARGSRSGCAQQGNPIGWFLSQVWDRFRDRTFWLTQQAVRNVRDHADVVLYLVNAPEAPDDAGYLAPELAVLAWIGKPVLVLLNQTGPPRPPADERADDRALARRAARDAHVRDVLTLDAFARCWVQEFALFERDRARAARRRKRPRSRACATAWRDAALAQFDAAMAALAAPIARGARAIASRCRATAAAKLGARWAIGARRGDGDRGARARATWPRALDGGPARAAPIG